MIFWIFKLISDFCLELYLLVCMSCTFQYVWVSHCWFLPWGCLTQACVSQVCAAENPRFLQCSLACMSALRGHESANTSSHTPKERSPCKDLCSKGFSREAGYINGRCIMAFCSPRVTCSSVPLSVSQLKGRCFFTTVQNGWKEAIFSK